MNSAIYIDPQTELMWAKNANIANEDMPWDESLDWVNSLSYGGYSDWRLPTKDELLIFSQRGVKFPIEWLIANGFVNVPEKSFSGYWTSSSGAFGDSNQVWVVYMDRECTGGSSKTGKNYVLPVRSESEHTPEIIYKDRLHGVSWTINENIVERELIYTDPDTGLMWPRDGNLPERMNIKWKDAARVIRWDEAKRLVRTINYGGYTDWRLPTKAELDAFVQKAGTWAPYAWFNTFGFHNVKSHWYWTGTEYRPSQYEDRYISWRVDFGRQYAPDGLNNRGCSKAHSNDDCYIWPVRNGGPEIKAPEISKQSWFARFLG